MSNLSINSKCIKCGSCLSLGYDFLKEDREGAIEVKEGTFLENDSVELKSIMEICPLGAFEYDKSVRIESNKEQLEKVKEKLKNWKGIAHITAENIPFDENKYQMNMPYDSGSSYTYSSDNAALKAAEDKFYNIAYSKIDVFILQVISQYRGEMLLPYYTYEADTNSVYYKENLKIKEMLSQAEKLSKKDLCSGFSDFDVNPSSDSTYKMLKKGELVGDNLVDSVHREFSSGSYSSLSSYRMYFDYDETERYAGKGLFGGDKYVSKYCYRSLYEAITELEKDLRSALKYRKDQIQNHAVEVVNALIDTYNKKAMEELNRKLDVL